MFKHVKELADFANSKTSPDGSRRYYTASGEHTLPSQQYSASYRVKPLWNGDSVLETRKPIR